MQTLRRLFSKPSNQEGGRKGEVGEFEGALFHSLLPTPSLAPTMCEPPNDSA